MTDIKTVDTLLHRYKDWLFQNITTRPIADAVEITLPILDRNNDHIQIYVKEFENEISDGVAIHRYLLTDDGYIISDLELAGCSLETEKRQELLLETINGLGVKLGDDNELQVMATESDFSQKFNNLIQAMLAVDDLAYLSTSNATNIFISEIRTWLMNKNVRYSPNVSLRGKNDIYYSFDILIPASADNTIPERIVESFGNFDLKQAEALAYRWGEVRQVRRNAKIYVIFNNKKISKTVGEICRVENIIPVSFAEIECIEKEIVA